MRFAHLSDVHLGFQREVKLQEIEECVFGRILDECISRKVDFILIAGDLFHTNIPEMRVQKFAFAKFRKVHEAGIPIYAVYGSHDSSPVSNSVIDLLAETNYITKVSLAQDREDDKILLEFTRDPGTGAKLVGLPGLKAGKDETYYEQLDRESLEAEQGFKIFLFHGGISEMKGNEMGDYMPLSLLPKGFDYYAGGHLHTHLHQQYETHGHVVYPGTPFIGHPSDLEKNARGTSRGYVMVEFDEDGVKEVEFVKVEGAEYALVEMDADGKTPESVNQELADKIREMNPDGRIVLLRASGDLSEGKTTEVDLLKSRRDLIERGAVSVQINHSSLHSSEYLITGTHGTTRDEIESGVFAENIKSNTRQKELAGESGVALAQKLLGCLTQNQLDNEKKLDYKSRIRAEAFKIMELRLDDT